MVNSISDRDGAALTAARALTVSNRELFMASALISGASIAGPALAYWLQRFGFSVTVVERSATLRPGGQPVDIRGAALEVVERMGLRQKVEASRTHMAGANVLDVRGNEIQRHTDRTLSGGRHDSGDIEIFRDDLCGILYDATKTVVDYRFDDSITSIHDDANTVTVTFERAPPRDFDLVIGADGITSGVRRLVFGASDPFMKFLGTYVTIFTADNFLGLKDWQTAITDQDDGMLVLPTRDNTELRVFMLVESERLSRDLTTAQQKALLIEKFKHYEWQVPRLLDCLKAAPDIYFGEIAQVQMPHWSCSRVALVGDAGYAPSPRSGQGTSLALVGAYVLATELAAQRHDHAAAFARYEARMRPFVELNQALVTYGRGTLGGEQALAHAKNAIALEP
jgi:2-polyprenyl-6-methoxyphenol hydroxylase-like FAD-dependent oxidoreductase